VLAGEAVVLVAVAEPVERSDVEVVARVELVGGQVVPEQDR